MKNRKSSMIEGVAVSAIKQDGTNWYITQTIGA